MATLALLTMVGFGPAVSAQGDDPSAALLGDSFQAASAIPPPLVGARTSAQPSTPIESRQTGITGGLDLGKLLNPDGGGDEESPGETGNAAPPTVQSWTAGVSGPTRIEVVVKASEPTRVDLLVDGGMVGSWSVDTSSTRLSAVALVAGTSTPIALAAPVDVDLVSYGTAPAPPLHTVRGTDVIGPDGEPVRLLGANRSGYDVWPGGGAWRNVGGHEGLHMALWGMNTVRIQLNQEHWLNDCPVDHSWVHDTPTKASGQPFTYREIIEEEVRRFNEHGIHAVLALRSVPGEKGPQDCTWRRSWQRQMPDSRSPEFWRSVASRFADWPLVAFDLYNEPQFDSHHHQYSESELDRLWRSGGDFTFRKNLLTTATYRTSGMQTLYNAVRNTGADNLIMVPGRNWALDVGVLMRRPLDGWGIVAKPHLYCQSCPQIPHSGQARSITGEAPGEAAAYGPSDRFPIYVGEFGQEGPWTPTDNARWLAWIEPLGFSWTVYHWAPGGWDDGESEYGILSYDAAAGEPRRPAPSGQPVWESLAPHRG